MSHTTARDGTPDHRRPLRAMTATWRSSAAATAAAGSRAPTATAAAPASLCKGGVGQDRGGHQDGRGNYEASNQLSHCVLHGKDVCPRLSKTDTSGCVTGLRHFTGSARSGEGLRHERCHHAATFRTRPRTPPRDQATPADRRRDACRRRRRRALHHGPYGRKVTAMWQRDETGLAAAASNAVRSVLPLSRLPGHPGIVRGRPCVHAFTGWCVMGTRVSASMLRPLVVSCLLYGMQSPVLAQAPASTPPVESRARRPDGRQQADPVGHVLTRGGVRRR